MANLNTIHADQIGYDFFFTVPGVGDSHVECPDGILGHDKARAWFECRMALRYTGFTLVWDAPKWYAPSAG